MCLAPASRVRACWMRLPAPAPLDPPYDDDGLEVTLRVAATHLAPDGAVVIEHRRSRDTPASEAGLTRTRVLVSGDSALSFYR